jgi:hypothetical protein
MILAMVLSNPRPLDVYFTPIIDIDPIYVAHDTGEFVDVTRGASGFLCAATTPECQSVFPPVRHRGRRASGKRDNRQGITVCLPIGERYALPKKTQKSDD